MGDCLLGVLCTTSTRMTQGRDGNYLVLFTMSEKDEVVTVARVLYARRELDARLK